MFQIPWFPKVNHRLYSLKLNELADLIRSEIDLMTDFTLHVQRLFLYLISVVITVLTIINF